MLDLKAVKQQRVRLGLTQSELAKEAGVSQSIVAKIEAGRVDPSYTIAQKILAALEQRRMSGAPKALDIMHTSVVSVKSSVKVADAVKLMKKHAISQLPVQDERIVGIITEGTVMSHLNALNGTVGEIMEATPPMVPPNADLTVVSNLLQHYPIVLVVEKGVLVGIITKSDVLGSLV
ncbi:MAG: CBS domain-containing protein [Candidatus Woesearchaeota archaeon]